MIAEEQFKRFYEQTSMALLSYLRRVERDPSLADDVFQEAYVRLLQSDLRDPSEAKLKSYLFTVATNLLRDHWRRAKKSVRWEDSAPDEHCADAGDNALDARIGVEKAFGRLNPQQRSLLWLAYVEMYSHEEIACMLNLRQKSVRVLLFRAKGKLVEVLHSMGIWKEGVL